MLVVIGLGGNALTHRGEQPDAAVTRARLEEAAASLAEVMAHGAVVITHGNGPQVGQAALARPDSGLDVLDAETEGELGYLIELALRNHCPDREVATLVTPVVVDADDPAFASPRKPIGPCYDEPTARRLAAERGWAIAPDGPGWRRVVASPEPREVLSLGAVNALRSAGVTVVCGGGGGIPVVRTADGTLVGVDAVIDKDLTTALLAAAMGADALLLLTDVPGVQTDFATADAKTLHKASSRYMAGLDLPAGSMGTKVAAACRFVDGTGAVAGIGRLQDASAVLMGRAGTIISAGPVETRWWH